MWIWSFVVSLFFNGGTQAIDDARKFAGTAVHGINCFLVNISGITGGIVARANFGKCVLLQLLMNVLQQFFSLNLLPCPYHLNGASD
jgi:hypothetical protein